MPQAPARKSEPCTPNIPSLESLIGREAAERIVAFRRDLHRHPEIGMETVRTSDKVEAMLRELGVDEIARFAKTGIAAVVRGAAGSAAPPARIGFRADMDALPAPDECGAAWASETPMRAHLCGHDGHTAGLLGFAAWAASHRADFAGEILLIFQPGEEGWAGADKMIKDGLFERYPVREVFAAHITGLEPLGKILAREGPMTACADLFDIVIEGRGGHGARPHQAVDPVPAAAELILGLQTIVSRNVDPALPAVISIGSVQAGDPGSRHAQPGAALGAGTLDYRLPPEVCLPRLYHKRGAVAMAREADEDNPGRESDACQFYIVWGKRHSSAVVEEQRERLDTLGGGAAMSEEMERTFSRPSRP